jgi:hypothetical protein
MAHFWHTGRASSHWSKCTRELFGTRKRERATYLYFPELAVTTACPTFLMGASGRRLQWLASLRFSGHGVQE